MSFDDLHRLKNLAQRHQWWDSINRIDFIIGNTGLKDSRIDQEILAWSTDEDFWVSRIAIDHQLKRKEKPIGNDDRPLFKIILIKKNFLLLRLSSGLYVNMPKRTLIG